MIEKEKAIRIVEKLIKDNSSELSNKFLDSHKKLIIMYREHTVELKEKSIIYLVKKDKEAKTLKVDLSKKEFKNLTELFNSEKTRKDKEYSMKSFEKLEGLIGER